MSSAIPPEPSVALAIEFRGVSIAFDDQVVLDRVSFSVPAGEMRIILGRAGSGKSTLLKLAIGLLMPDEGQILLNGVDLLSLAEAKLYQLRKRFGVVFQEDALFTSMSVAENVAYRLLEQGKDIDEVEDEVRQTLRLVGLEHAIHKMPSELSGGMSRRTAVARALIGRPEMILYDSPCSGLDPVIVRRVLRVIMRLRDVERVTSLYVTQNMDEVKYLSSGYFEVVDGRPHFRKERGGFYITNSRILMLANGGIIFDQPDEMFWTSKDPEIRQFLA